MVSILDGLLLGLHGLADPIVLLMLVVGSLIGTLTGSLPGLGVVSAMVLLMPIAFAMETPAQGMTLLAAIYLGTMFGGRITAILINVPGEAQAVVTTFDGHPMMKQGRGGAALGISALSSFFGGLVSFILLAGLAVPLAHFALNFGPPEYTAVILFGFAAVIGLAEKQYLRSLITMCLGALITMVGIDFMTPTQRYVFMMELFDGIPFPIIALGVFGIAEVMVLSEKIPKMDTGLRTGKKTLSLRSLVPSLAEIKQCTPGIFRGTAIGCGLGILPGPGATIATFVAYSAEKSLAKDPSRLGKGAIEGVAAPEAAANASVGGSIIPTVALGIPGSAAAAILLGAMMMFGLHAGPRVFVDPVSASVVWTLIVGLFVANIVLLLCNTLMIPFFVWLIDVGQRHLKPIIVASAMIGAFAVTFSVTAMYICIVFGILGYIMKKLNYPVGPFLLSLVLFQTLETTSRQALVISGGDFSIFFRGPISITFMVLAILSFGYPLIRDRISSKKKAS